MNLLLDELPNAVVLGDKKYEFNTDFRACIILEQILHDDSMTDVEKVQCTLSLFYFDKEIEAEYISQALDEILRFYNCGKETEEVQERKSKNGDVEVKQKVYYDFRYDDSYIYAAFMEVYGIDLNTVNNLHWWKFQALFNSLPDTCKFTRIVGYRATDTSKIKDKNEKARIRKLQRIYALPNNYTKEDNIAMAGIAFGGSFAK